jgi:hypothetical protein
LLWFIIAMIVVAGQFISSTEPVEASTHSKGT